MKNLKDILYKVAIESVHGSTDVAVDKVAFDSRNIASNDVFVAIKGLLSDGHDFITQAVDQGALVVICEVLPTTIASNVTYVRVADSHTALAYIADNYYDSPSKELKLIGVTGTNGKTTVTSLLYQLFNKAGYKTGLLSTVKVMVGNEEFKATHTTPDSLTINRYLRQMVESGVDYCFMEVSSHGIHQKRTEGLSFDGGVFTNLTHDHLDYHNTFSEYRDVKKKFFDELPKEAFALINSDDKNGPVMVQNTKAIKKTYALKTFSDYKAHVLENQITGLVLKINNNELWTRLIGDFNAYNLLAIYGVAVELGLDELEVLRLISELESVSGRFQYIVTDNKVTAIVDYAHTPDALKNVLRTINSIRTHNEQLITVVGCGGDRDRAKRPLMGGIASDLSSKVVFTSDNPRTENPKIILDEIEGGVSGENYKKTIVVEDRKQAIKTACQMSESGDIILIAGKGHESYQEVNGVRADFDDMKIVQEILQKLNK